MARKVLEFVFWNWLRKSWALLRLYNISNVCRNWNTLRVANQRYMTILAYSALNACLILAKKIWKFKEYCFPKHRRKSKVTIDYTRWWKKQICIDIIGCRPPYVSTQLLPYCIAEDQNYRWSVIRECVVFNCLVLRTCSDPMPSFSNWRNLYAMLCVPYVTVTNAFMTILIILAPS